MQSVVFVMVTLALIHPSHHIKLIINREKIIIGETPLIFVKVHSKTYATVPSKKISEYENHE